MSIVPRRKAIRYLIETWHESGMDDEMSFKEFAKSYKDEVLVDDGDQYEWIKKTDLKEWLKRQKEISGGNIYNNMEYLPYDASGYGGMPIGGKYRTKGSPTKAKAKNAFIQSLVDKGYSEQYARMAFGKEEKRKGIIHSTKKSHKGKGGMIIGGMPIGGKYRIRRDNQGKKNIAQSQMKFIENMLKRGYTNSEAITMLLREEKNPKLIHLNKIRKYKRYANIKKMKTSSKGIKSFVLFMKENKGERKPNEDYRKFQKRMGVLYRAIHTKIPED